MDIHERFSIYHMNLQKYTQIYSQHPLDLIHQLGKIDLETLREVASSSW